MLFNITGSRSIGLHEMNAAAKVIAEIVDPDAEIIFGTATDPNLGDEIKVTVIATGFQPAELRERAIEEVLGHGERLRPMRIQTLQNVGDTDLPTFLRRTVSLR